MLDLRKQIRLSSIDLKRLLPDGVEIIGLDEKVVVTSFKSIFEADENSMTFIDAKRPDKIELFQKTKGKVVCVDSQFIKRIPDLNGKCAIVSKDPKYTFAFIVNTVMKSEQQGFIHPSAIIHEKANIHSTAFIGPNVYIGESKIGINSIIMGNTYVYDGVSIGNNVVIHAGCIIGSEGFGYLRSEEGELINFPHIGGVIIENDVELQALTHVSRGALGNTVIGKGTKTDSCVHIAHNNVIGRNNLFCAHTMLSGSVKVGDNNFFGPSSSVKDVITIGNGNLIGIASLISKNIEDNLVIAGNPGRELSQLKKLQRAIQKLIDEKED